VLALLVAMTLLGEGRHINAVAATALLIAPNVAGIVVWALLTVLGARSRGGAFGRAVAALARHRRAPAHVRRVWPSAARSTRNTSRLGAGRAQPLLWALVYAAAALIVGVVLALASTGSAGRPPSSRRRRCTTRRRRSPGCPSTSACRRGAEQLDDPDASRLLGRWLIASTLAYGTLPHAAGAVVRRGADARARGRLDLDRPYYRRLIARFEALAPTRVLDAEHAEHAAPAPAPRPRPAAVNPARWC
jgi:hypothetical protein